MKNFILTTTMCLMAVPAFAHSKANGMVPANGSTVVEMPENIMLNFENEMRLTRVDLTSTVGVDEELDRGDQTTFSKEFMVPVTSMGSGTYSVEWRGLGSDGHPMQGDFSFTVE